MLPVRSAIRRASAAATSKQLIKPVVNRSYSSIEFDDVSPVNGAPRIPSPWHRWFPYEPVPCSPQLKPYNVYVEDNKVYHWCTCGESTTEPWCDDAPNAERCRTRGFVPDPCIPKYKGTKAMCGCKHSSMRPYCNGTCMLVRADISIVPACIVSFGACFVLGAFSTWFIHP